MHPFVATPVLESSAGFAIDLQERLGSELCRWRAEVLAELRDLVLDARPAARDWWNKLKPHARDAYYVPGLSEVAC